ncbi:heavy metal translocating P-type ATPase [Desulfobulbus sp. TB]|nr:heavy metal translocating P-type ATPase [Desulfobulbus sp. TB]
MSTLDAVCQQFVQETIDPLFGDTRGYQLKALSSTGDLPKVSKEEKKENRLLMLAFGNILLAGIFEVFYPPFLIVTIPFIFLFCVDRFQEACNALFRERRFRSSVLDSIFVIWLLASKYFFLGSLVIFFVSLHKKLLVRIKKNTQKKVIDVFERHPTSVWILRDATEIEIPFEGLHSGDTVVVNAGETIPADGKITDGTASVDQHILTGESMPAEKGIGEKVLAGTFIVSGRICVLVESTGQETISAQIGEILNRTTNHKTSAELATERLVDQLTLPTLGLSAVAYAFAGSSGGLAVLYSSIGYNMRIFGPLNILSFLKIASRQGILIKDGRSLENLVKVDTIVFDKTGTLTLEELHVSSLYTCNKFSEDMLISYAAAAEYRQRHPIAKAILAAAEVRGLILPDIDNAHYEVGYGIKVGLSDRLVRVGSERFMKMENIPVPTNIQNIQTECGLQGYSLVMVAVDNELVGAIELHPSVRPEAKYAISKIQQHGIATYIISGDHKEPTRSLAEKLGIDHWSAEVLPEQKSEIIEQLQKRGKTVCFVGDGVNDSIALKRADVSISLSSASTAAIDTAQIILMDGNLNGINTLLDISRKSEINQKKNIVISVVPGIICLGGVFLFHLGVYPAMLLYYGGLVIGIKNSIYPKVYIEND